MGSGMVLTEYLDPSFRINFPKKKEPKFGIQNLPLEGIGGNRREFNNGQTVSCLGRGKGLFWRKILGKEGLE